MPDTVLTEVRDGVGTLTLNRPEVMNTLDTRMAEALAQATADFAQRPEVRCVVVRGAGGRFMAGGDINYFGECLRMDAKRRQTAIGAIVGVVHDVIRNLRRMPKPVVASVQGACAGFGVSLLAACDLAVAAEDTVFSLAYCKIGITPDGASTWFLPRMLGMKRAMELALLGNRYSAEQALAMGLVNTVVPGDELAVHTEALANTLARGPSAVLARTKALLNASAEASLEQQLDAEERSFLDGIIAPEFEEGVTAFLEKRAPEF